MLNLNKKALELVRRDAARNFRLDPVIINKYLRYAKWYCCHFCSVERYHSRYHTHSCCLYSNWPFCKRWQKIYVFFSSFIFV